jgi:hypothetical protein
MGIWDLYFLNLLQSRSNCWMVFLQFVTLRHCIPWDLWWPSWIGEVKFFPMVKNTAQGESLVWSTCFPCLEERGRWHITYYKGLEGISWEATSMCIYHERGIFPIVTQGWGESLLTCPRILTACEPTIEGEVLCSETTSM